MNAQNPSHQTTGQSITLEREGLIVPPHPLIAYIAGDGIGPEIWRAARRVLDTAIELAYTGERSIAWQSAGESLLDGSGQGIDERSLQLFNDLRVGIKGPVTTPVGKGFRSLNVALRRALDLYVCLRPVNWIPGVPTPVLHPELVDMVIFRENTEDVYAGIEFETGTAELEQFMLNFRQQFPEQFARIRFPFTSAIGIKPVSREGSQRLVRAAVDWALENRRKSVTLVHKGNVMKHTEGGFQKWAYEFARKEYSEQVFTMQEWHEQNQKEGLVAANRLWTDALDSGKLIIKDMIADAMFAGVLTRPQDFDVIATTNLNGDYLSDALAAQVGGLGLAPGANINYDTGHAVFEATHGSAPDIAGRNIANPTSLILSGEMLLRYLGWPEAASLVREAVEKTIKKEILTIDLHVMIPGSTLVSTSAFGDALIASMRS